MEWYLKKRVGKKNKKRINSKTYLGHIAQHKPVRRVFFFEAVEDDKGRGVERKEKGRWHELARQVS